MKNANQNKVHSVHDFIIFLKAKIAIIIITTGLLSSLAVYTQVDYVDYWDVKLSRTVNRVVVMETMMILEKTGSQIEVIKRSLASVLVEFEKFGSDTQDVKRIKTFIQKFSNVSSHSPVNFFSEINKFVNSLMVNVLSNQNIKYEGIVDSNRTEDVFKKQNIKLIISSNDIINEDDLRKKLNSFFNDVLDKSEQIIKMQNHINDENYSFKAYNFNIEEITRVEGYDYVKVIKIVSMILISCIFFLYVFHIRKLIKLF